MDAGNKWHVGQEQIRVICLWFFAAIAVLYGRVFGELFEEKKGGGVTIKVKVA